MAFFAFQFPAISLVTLNKPWNLTAWSALVTLSHWLAKRSDLEQKVVWFVNKSLAERQSECKDLFTSDL